MRKNTVRRNAKRTGMKAAILMAALLAVGTPFAVHTYNAQRQTNVQVVEAETEAIGATVSTNTASTDTASTNTASAAKAATGSKTASTKASQKAQNDTVSEKTTATTTEAAASAKAAASTSQAATSETAKAAKSSTDATASTTSASSSKTTADTLTVVSKNMTVYATATSGLNVRSSADASSKAIGYLNYRDSVKVTGSVQKNGKDTGWYRVSFNGTTGYVNASYVSTTQPAAPKKETTPAKSEVDTLTLTRMMGNGEVRTICVWSDGSMTDGNGVTYTAVNGYEYKSSDGYFWCEGYQVDTMTFYQIMGNEVRTACVWSDGSIYDGNGVYYTAINGYEYTSTDGLLWSTEPSEEKEETTEVEKQEESSVTEKVEEQEESVEAETPAESAVAEKAEEQESAAEQEVKATVTMTVSVKEGYLALRTSADADTDNEKAQLKDGEVVEVSREGLNACDKYVFVTVKSTGMTGYVNVEFLK